MEITVNCRLAGALAQQIRVGREELTHRWLERIAARVAIDPNRIFPTEELLDHVPLLMDGIADYLADPTDEIAADVAIVAKAMELGELRHAQGFGAHEILKEYEILGGVLFAFIVRTADEVDEPCTRGELFACGHRLFRAVSVIQQVTTTHFLRLAEQGVSEREERLRGFNRTVSHELKNAIGAVLGAGQLLQEDWVMNDPRQRSRFARIVVENAEAMQSVLENLMVLSRTETDARKQRHILLPEAVAETVRQLREMARAQGVELRVADDLPPIEVNAAAVELCLVNYVSNAIKYSDPSKRQRWVEVRGWLRIDPGTGSGELQVEVRDNGLGVPEQARGQLFERFYRAHERIAAEVEGTGLGLSLVRETVATLGGRAWAEFHDDGTSFFIALPVRREADAVAAAGGEPARAAPAANG